MEITLLHDILMTFKRFALDSDIDKPFMGSALHRKQRCPI